MITRPNGSASLPTQDVLNVPISLLSMEEVIASFEERIRSRIPSLVVTADASALVLAHEDPKFRDEIRQAYLVTADGAGVLWALRRAGIKNPPKVSGVDLVEEMCRRSADHGHRIYFLGAAPGVAELAAERLRLKYPGCNIVGAQHGYFPADDNRIIGEQVAAAKPDILFVAMGMPRQERFILETQDLIQAPIAIGVGGSFDVFSGKTKRAPRWVQAIHMEWFWRLALNPSKFQKVKLLPKFVRLVRNGS